MGVKVIKYFELQRVEHLCFILSSASYYSEDSQLDKRIQDAEEYDSIGCKTMISPDLWA